MSYLHNVGIITSPSLDENPILFDRFILACCIYHGISLEPEILGTGCWVCTGAIYVDPLYLLSRLLPHKIPILENVLENRLSLFSRNFSDSPQC